MGSALRSLAGYLPLTRVTDAVRDPWLGVGTATGSLLVVAGSGGGRHGPGRAPIGSLTVSRAPSGRPARDWPIRGRYGRPGRP